MAKKTIKTTTEQVCEEKTENLTVESEPKVDVEQIVESQNEINDEDIEDVVVSDEIAPVVEESVASDAVDAPVEKKSGFFSDLGGKVKGLFSKRRTGSKK